MNLIFGNEVSTNSNVLFPGVRIVAFIMDIDPTRFLRLCIHTFPLKKAIESFKIHSQTWGQHGKLGMLRLDLVWFSSSTIEPITEEIDHPKLVPSDPSNSTPKDEGFERY